MKTPAQRYFFLSEELLLFLCFTAAVSNINVLPDYSSNWQAMAALLFPSHDALKKRGLKAAGGVAAGGMDGAGPEQVHEGHHQRRQNRYQEEEQQEESAPRMAKIQGPSEAIAPGYE